MAATLVAVKSRTQRRIESIVLLIAMPASAYAVWRAAGPTLMTPLLVLFEFYLIPSLGAVLAASLTSERVTIEESVRRTTMRVFEPPAALRFGVLFLAYLDLSLSASLPLVGREGIPDTVLPAILSFAVAAALLLTLVTFLQHRRRYRNYLVADVPGIVLPVPYTPREWLSKALPAHYGIWFATLFGAYQIAQELNDGTARTLVMLGGMWAAYLVEVLLASLSRAKRPPTLWTQFGFGMALLTAVLHMGVPFAGFGWLQATLTSEDTIGRVISAGAGLLFGTFMIMMVWGLTRLYVFDPRRRRS